MKIRQGNTIYTYDFLSAVDPAKAKAEASILRCKDIDGNPVEVTISDEAYKFMKEFKGGTTSIDLEEAIKQSFREYDENFERDFTNNYISDLCRLSQDVSKGFTGFSNMSLSEITKDFFEAYTTLYNKIVKSYDDNTREICVRKGEDYHIITKEEDIAFLNRAFDFLSSDVGESAYSKSWPHMIYGPKPRDISIPERNQRDIDDVADKMVAARKSYAAQYPQTASKTEIQSFIQKTFGSNSDFAKLIARAFPNAPY